MPHYREEVLNVYLAELLRDRGVISVPESITQRGSHRKMPDVVVEFFGLRVMLEGKVGDTPQAKIKALEAAQNRLEQGIAQIGVAVVYPAALRKASDIKAALAQSELEIAIVTESQEIGYTKGDIDYLKSALNLAFEHLVEEDVVAEAVAALDAGIDRFSESIVGKTGVIKRLADALDLTEPAGVKDKAKHATSTAHISGLVITNAMIFQEILSDTDARIWPLHRLESEADMIGAFANHWRMIIAEINYYPIFYIASELLLNLASRQDLQAFLALSDAAKAIVRNKAALRHDLMGRVYHRLLADAKYLGTYYTSIPAATLLLRLALQATDWELPWHDLVALESFRVADLACGTGTLLTAAAEALTNNYIGASVNADSDIELEKLHQVLLESVIHGYDVLASAIHLTASTLAMRSPKIAFEKMNLISFPLGGSQHSLGSIEFLREAQFALPDFTDIFGAVTQGEQVTGSGAESVAVPRPPELDLCVMNPPFTRSVGGNLLFGSSPPAERAAMQKELKKLLRARNISASSTAGLGAIFVAIGDKYLKPGGRIALVLPKALISGIAWGKTRDIFRQKYQVEMLIASQDPAQWNFSESTSLSEVLLIARKITAEPIQGHNPAAMDGRVVALNLWRNPQTSFEALAVVQALHQQNPPFITIGQGTASLRVGDQKVGEAIAFPWEDLRKRESWMLPCAFAQTDLIRTAYQLLQGRLRLPGYSETADIPLTPLETLGELGPDRRDIYDGFELTTEKTPYAAFWGHDAEAVQSLAQTATHHLAALAQAKAGRPLRKSEQLWPRAGRLLLAERMWLNTQRLFAIRLPQPVLANVWWSFALNPAVREAVEKTLALWLNSTLGLLILFANRDETRGAWVDFKKPTLHALPVLDVLNLAPAQTTALANVYDQLCQETLQPFPNMAHDPVRAQIDAALAQTLHLPDFTILRELLAQEPVVCLKPLS